MFYFQYFRDRTFALGAGIYVGSWGVHIYLDFWRWCLTYESHPRIKPTQPKYPPIDAVITEKRKRPDLVIDEQ